MIRTCARLLGLLAVAAAIILLGCWRIGFSTLFRLRRPL